MASQERNPFEIHSSSWYEAPLDYKAIIYEFNHENHVAKITMNRPQAMNALNHQLRAELSHALKVAERDNEINAIILKGAGRCFSAGYDLGGGMGAEEPDLGSQYVGASHWPRYVVQMWWQLWELSKVVIAQTHGYVIAGATELCSMCDLLVTTPDCQFGYPVARNQGMDLCWFPWLLPMRKAHEMLLSGGSITGEEAYRLGMANYCVTEKHIDEFTETFAKRVALTPWQLATLYKRALKKTYEIQGIRTAMETGALYVLDMAAQTDTVKETMEMMRKMPLREYFAARDKPYRDYKKEEEAILNRSVIKE